MIRAALLAGAFALALWGCQRESIDCGAEETAAARARLEDLAARFEDSERLASVTSRIALSGPVAKLQDLRRDAGAIRVPHCLRRAHYLLVERMDLVISGFMLFMADSDSVDAAAATLVASTTKADYETQFRGALNDVSLCAPYCPHLDGWTEQKELAARSGRAERTRIAREKRDAEEKARAVEAARQQRERDAAANRAELEQARARAAEQERAAAANAEALQRLQVEQQATRRLERQERIATLRDDMQRWHRGYLQAIAPLKAATAQAAADRHSAPACARLAEAVASARRDRRLGDVPDDDVARALQQVIDAYERGARACERGDGAAVELHGSVASSALQRLAYALDSYSLEP